MPGNVCHSARHPGEPRSATTLASQYRLGPGPVFRVSDRLVNPFLFTFSKTVRSKQIIHMVSCHAEGEVGNVIVGGVAPPPGENLWQQARWIARDQSLRKFVLNEPRGGVFKHINLLVPAIQPEAQFGFIIMEPEHTPPMSGSNSICVATVLLDSGLIAMQEPLTEFVLEAPGGLVPVKAYCENGKAQSIEVHNVASFAGQLNVSIEVEGIGTLTVDTAYGGDSFVLVDASSLGFEIKPEEASRPGTAGSKNNGGGQPAARIYPSR